QGEARITYVIAPVKRFCKLFWDGSSRLDAEAFRVDPVTRIDDQRHARSLHVLHDVGVGGDQDAALGIDVDHAQEGALAWQGQDAEGLVARIEAVDHVAVRGGDPHHAAQWIPGGGIGGGSHVGQVVDADHAAAAGIEFGELAAAVKGKVEHVFVVDGDTPRAGVRVGQGEGADVLLRIDVEAAEDAVAELTVPEFAVVAGHAQAVERGAATAFRVHRC